MSEYYGFTPAASWGTNIATSYCNFYTDEYKTIKGNEQVDSGWDKDAND